MFVSDLLKILAPQEYLLQFQDLAFSYESTATVDFAADELSFLVRRVGAQLQILLDLFRKSTSSHFFLSNDSCKRKGREELVSR